MRAPLSSCEGTTQAGRDVDTKTRLIRAISDHGKMILEHCIIRLPALSRGRGDGEIKKERKEKRDQKAGRAVVGGHA